MGFNSYTSDFFVMHTCGVSGFTSQHPWTKAAQLIRFIAQLTPIKITVSSVDPTAPGTALQSVHTPVF